MSKLEDMKLRTVSRKGNSKSITIPQHWAEIGETVVVTVKDADTLIISKSLHG